MTQPPLPGLPLTAAPPPIWLHHLAPEDAMAADERLLAEQIAALSSQVAALRNAAALAHDPDTAAAITAAAEAVRAGMVPLIRAMGSAVS